MPSRSSSDNSPSAIQNNNLAHNKQMALSEENQTNSSALSTANTSTLSNTSNDWSPSVQNLLDKPPSSFPLRFILGSLVFGAAIAAWAWFGHIEKVGRAQGKLIPKGDTYKIEPTKNGKIQQLHIEEGEKVVKGETLASLDTEQIEQKINQLKKKLANYQDQLQEKQNLLRVTKLKASNQQKIAKSDIQSQKIVLEKAKERVTVKNQQLQTLKSEVSQNEKRVKRLKPLQQNGAISQEYLFQAQQSLQNSQMKLLRIKNEVNSAKKEVQRRQENLAKLREKTNQVQLKSKQQIKQIQISIEQLEGKIAETKNQLSIAKNKQQKTILKSPVNGTVLSLNLQNIGQVIKPGQTIAEIAPKDAPLVLDAAVPAKEAGFLEKEMPVKIKFDAYPYQDYGVVEGAVSSISPNSHTNKKGTFYKVQIALEQNHIKHNQEKIKFQAGQSANAKKCQFGNTLSFTIVKLINVKG